MTLAADAMAAAHQYIYAMEWKNDSEHKLAIAICSALTRAIHEEPTLAQLIQHVYTQGGQAAVAGIPDVYHDCDAMRCSSLEHIIARVPHTVDESPALTREQGDKAAAAIAVECCGRKLHYYAHCSICDNDE